MTNLNIVLYQPEIPPNTGSIARLCACTGANLHLIRPLGFKTDDKHLRRAGLDYWHFVSVSYYNSFEALVEKYPAARYFFFSSKVEKFFTQVEYQAGDFLVFGPETRGLPDSLKEKARGDWLTIPMFAQTRSLNLAMSVGIAAYEALKQIKGL